MIKSALKGIGWVATIAVGSIIAFVGGCFLTLWLINQFG